MARPVGSMERSLAAVTIGMARDQKSRRLALADTHQGEWEQQIHLPISGQATNVVAHVDCDVSWELPFLYAPQQRQVPFEVPHFTKGFEQTVQTAALIRYDAYVTQWAKNDQGWITGAVVRIIVDAPNVPAVGPAIPYQATAHLSFEGYATMPEGDEFLT